MIGGTPAGATEMALDPRIILGFQPPQIQGPADIYAKAMTLKQLLQQGQMGDMQIDRANRDLVAENALNAAYVTAQRPDGTLDRNALTGELATRNLGSRIPGVMKGFLETDKLAGEIGLTNARARGSNMETAQKSYESVQRTLGALYNDPGATKAKAAAAIASQQQAGIVSPELAQKMIDQLPDDPAALRPALLQALNERLTPEQTLTLFAPKPVTADTGGNILTRDMNALSPTFGRDIMPPVQKVATPEALLSSADRARALAQQASESAASRGVQIRGQNLTDARARETNVAGTFDAERGVIVDRRTGTARPVTLADGSPLPAKDNGKPLNDSQSKAALFGARMKSADATLAALAEAGTTKSVPGSRLPMGMGAAIGAISPAAQQQLDQAKRDFINATLRRESGAAIGNSEFQNAEQQYFPQIGDKPETIKQKANNRAIAIRGILAEVPPASRDKLMTEILGDQAGGGASGGWKIERVK